MPGVYGGLVVVIMYAGFIDNESYLITQNNLDILTQNNLRIDVQEA